MRKLICDLDWSNENPTLIYSAQFSKNDNGEMILAAGSGSNEAKFFETTNYKVFAVVQEVQAPIYTIDFSNQGTMAAIGSADGNIRILNINLS